MLGEGVKIIPMVRFILDIDRMGIKEFYDKIRITEPVLHDSIVRNGDNFLHILAVQYRLYVEYAKFLDTNVTVDILCDNLGFTQLEDVMDVYDRYANAENIVIYDGESFWLCKAGEMEVKPLKRIEDLTHLELVYQNK